MFVDDRPEDMPIGATVVPVSPYLAPNPHDVVLRRLIDGLAEPAALDGPDKSVLGLQGLRRRLSN